EGLGFAVTSKVARQLLEQKSFWSGVGGYLLSGDLAKVFILPPPGAGLLVQRVAAGPPADRIGLKGGSTRATIGDDDIVVGGDIIFGILAASGQERHLTRGPLTLDRHLKDATGAGRGLPPGLPALLTALATAARTLSRQVRRAALSGSLGYSGDTNVTGDSQKKLDVIGDETMLEAAASSGVVAAVVSEELKGAKLLDERAEARTILCIDPI